MRNVSEEKYFDEQLERICEFCASERDYFKCILLKFQKLLPSVIPFQGIIKSIRKSCRNALSSLIEINLICILFHWIIQKQLMFHYSIVVKILIQELDLMY